MSAPDDLLRANAPRLCALAVIGALFGLARLPAATESERAELAARFRFERSTLDVGVSARDARVRRVHPDYAHIDGWISTVGAAVALDDLDGDGLPNDLVLVDPRSDRVIVMPVPGGETRFGRFTLEPRSLPYDPTRMAPMGCVPGDLNEDGRGDVLVYYWGRAPIVFLSRGPLAGGAASFVERELVPEPSIWNTNALTRADVDGDGHADLVVGNYFPDDAPILDARSTTPMRLHDSMSRAYDGGRNRVLLWRSASGGAEPDVRYEEVDTGLDAALLEGWTLAVGAADLDGDTLPELYFANDFGPDRLLHNRSLPGAPRFALLAGRKEFTSPNSKVVGRDSFKGMGVDFADLDGDGWLDIFVSNIAVEYGLEESHLAFVSTGAVEEMQHGRAPYVERSEALGIARGGWGWDARFGDFDNDGGLELVQATGFLAGSVNRWPELHEVAMGNDQLLGRPGQWHRFSSGDDLSGRQRDCFYVRAANGVFVDLAREVGLDGTQVGRGLATGDVDGDGDLDLLVANQWGASVFQRNVAPSAGRFLGLHLRLPLDDEERATRALAGHPLEALRTRAAIGAEARLELPDGRVLVAQVDGGNGHSGVRSKALHFGLGELAADAELEVALRWRDAHGRARAERVRLAPGWHTLVLGRGQELAER